MKAAIALIFALVPATAFAQMPGVIMDRPTGLTFTDNSSGMWASATGRALTPTMQRQQLAQAIALRAETIAFLDQDGGTLSDHHQRYVKRKARLILTGH
jgi:hypothetical protein